MWVKRTEIFTDYSLKYVVDICQVSYRLLKGSHLSRRNKKKCLEEFCALTKKTPYCHQFVSWTRILSKLSGNEVLIYGYVSTYLLYFNSFPIPNAKTFGLTPFIKFLAFCVLGTVCYVGETGHT